MEKRINTTNTNDKNNKSRRQINHDNRIQDARSESRQEFTKIKFTDPREEWSKIPAKIAKERRQKTIKETRLARMEENKNELDTESSNDLNQLRIAVKQITQTLNLFMETTNKEIENIRKIIEQNHKMTNEESNEVKNIKF